MSTPPDEIDRSYYGWGVIHVCDPSCKVLNAGVGTGKSLERRWSSSIPQWSVVCFQGRGASRRPGLWGPQDPGWSSGGAPDAAALHPAEIVLLSFSRSSAAQRPGARPCVTNTARSVRTSRASVKVEIHLGSRQFLPTRPIKQQLIRGVKLARSCGGVSLESVKLFNLRP